MGFYELHHFLAVPGYHYYSVVCCHVHVSAMLSASANPPITVHSARARLYRVADQRRVRRFKDRHGVTVAEFAADTMTVTCELNQVVIQWIIPIGQTDRHLFGGRFRNVEDFRGFMAV